MRRGELVITLKEIAAEAGVSVMTVSNVINRNWARVSPEKAEQILAIIDKYHYVPNMAARSLSSKASHIVAVLLPLWYETADSLLLDPYAGQMAGMLEMLLREKGYYVMLCSFRTAGQVLTLQRNWQVDGSILILPHEDSITHELAEKSVSPLVVIDRRFDDLPMLSVLVDDEKGGYLAAKYLLERGHRRIAFAGPSLEDSSVIHNRYSGFTRALAEYGLAPDPELAFSGYYHQPGGEEAGRRLLRMERRPSAVIATEDSIACGIMKTCQAAGMRVPEELSLIGFDDSMPARLVSPGLTTVRQDIRHKAACAVNMLLGAIHDDRKRDDSVTLSVEIVERESVAPWTE